MYTGGAGGRRCEIGPFRLDGTRSRRTARLYVNSQFVSLTLQDIEYLSRMLNIVQLRDYIVALQPLTSATYVEPSPDEGKNVDFPHLHEALISFV